MYVVFHAVITEKAPSTYYGAEPHWQHINEECEKISSAQMLHLQINCFKQLR